MIRLNCKTPPQLDQLLRSDTERLAAEEEYWGSDCFYRLRAEAVERLLKPAAEELWALCREYAGRAVGDAEILASLGIPEHLWTGIRDSWMRQDPVALTRFDLSFDGRAAPRLHECNIDVVGLLFEATFYQRRWFEHQRGADHAFRHATQCAGIEEALAAAVIRGNLRRVTMASLQPEPYDALWIETLSGIFGQHGATCRREDFDSVEAFCSSITQPSYQVDRPVIIKSFRWDAINDSHAAASSLVKAAPSLYAPMWSQVLSTKGCLPWLWKMFPGHPNLVPATFDPRELAGSAGVVAKPLFSIQGQNVTLDDRVSPHRSMATQGPDRTGRRIFQELCYLPEFESDGGTRWTSTGAWIVNDRFAALSLTESSRPVISSDDVRYVTHVLA